ncbi:hypothetical protein XF35_35640 [Streptomyces platensis subsp. clarensis]|nr:hypothetical protein [Streptomyces platensis subsp. clarensis]
MALPVRPEILFSVSRLLAHFVPEIPRAIHANRACFLCRALLQLTFFHREFLMSDLPPRAPHALPIGCPMSVAAW